MKGRLPHCAVAILMLSALPGCSSSSAPEPGTPALPSSPLFFGYGSYETLETVRTRLPQQSTWRVLSDSKASPRPGCPRFDELTFTAPANHLGHTGTLQLTLINDRLETTLFVPDDFDGYLAALAGTGLRFADAREATIPPATAVWLSNPATPQLGRFVGWRDERFSDQVRRWIEKCS